MVDNELLILVYEKLQSLSGNVKEIKSSVNGLSSKIESINKRVAELENTVNDVINPGITTIGDGHVDVRKDLMDTRNKFEIEFGSLKEKVESELREVKNTHNMLNAKIEAYELQQQKIAADLKTVRKSVN